MRYVCLPMIAAVCIPAIAFGGDDAAQREAIRQAVEKGLAIVQKSARSYPDNRDCFSCHHQTLPLLAMRAAREAGFSIDADLFKDQLQFTRDSLASRKDSLVEGKNIGGRAMTVSYALWTWQIAAEPRDDLSQAMVSYLLKSQEPNGSWKPPSNRPPLEESSVTCTVLSAYTLTEYADESSRDAAAQARDRARDWLRAAECRHHEDRVFGLWGRILLDEPSTERNAAARALFAAQRPDGSWSQEIELPGDAYATGQAIYVLREAGIARDDPAIQRAIQFLLQSQEMDGSWHVVTRSKPIQTYFDNGDPHGKDQFISIPATAWATAALARCLPGLEDTGNQEQKETKETK